MTMMRHVSAAPAETRDDGDDILAAPEETRDDGDDVLAAPAETRDVSAAPAETRDDGDDDARCWLDCDLIIIILPPPLVKVVGVVRPFPLSVLTDSAKSQLQKLDAH